MIKLLHGDCRTVLPTLDAGSVHCCVTSPPYFGLRDYGVDGQIGLERSPDAYIAELVAVFREVRRVLRDDGTLWLNLGDSYARAIEKGGSGPNGKNGHGEGYTEARHNLLQKLGDVGVRPPSQSKSLQHSDENAVPPLPSQIGSSDGGVGRADRPGSRSASAKPKDLLMIPARVALALQADGWWLRSDIIWHKPNPMPESVTDRPTSAHEHIFLLSKRERYWYDQEAVKEPAIYFDKDAPQEAVYKDARSFDGKHSDKQRGHGRRHAGFNARWDAMPKDEQCGGMRNLRNVWTIATAPFAEAHFATFPPELAERCIRAGCPKDGTVLDPFSGAGTTGLVADRLQRNAVLIELNPAYAEMTSNRIGKDAGMFASIE